MNSHNHNYLTFLCFVQLWIVTLPLKSQMVCLLDGELQKTKGLNCNIIFYFPHDWSVRSYFHFPPLPKFATQVLQRFCNELSQKTYITQNKSN